MAVNSSSANGNGQRRNGKPCAGHFGSAIGVNDWTECTRCGGTGRTSDARCDLRGGEGWFYARKGIWMTEPRITMRVHL
jgi:hypothetical protein